MSALLDLLRAERTTASAVDKSGTVNEVDTALRVRENHGFNRGNLYKQQTLPKLKEEFNIANDLSVPKLEKIVLNVGAAEGAQKEEVLEKVKEQLAVITGQTPRITRAKKAISAFKLRENDPIGVMVTLRGNRAWNFIQKFIAIVIPRMRDFRGMDEGKFDKMGNYSVGLTEQILFPEIDYSKIDKTRGMVVTFVIKNSDPQKSKRFLEILGMPFRKEVVR